MIDAPEVDLPEPGLWIGGELVPATGGVVFPHRYAANGRPTADVPLAGAADVDRAVQAARAALPGWRALPANERRNRLLVMARLIVERAELLSNLNVLDNGTPLLIAAAQNGMAADLFTYNAGWADKIGGELIDTWPSAALDYSRLEPYGVVGVIIPWNGPVTAIGQVLAPALAAGNCVVLKPPELAPFSAMAMGALFAEAGFPPGVVNVLPGGGEAGDALVRHPGVDKVHFTGSAATARLIARAAADTLTPLGFELGGKSAVVAFEDADPATVARAAVGFISVSLAGQGCINGTRVLVHRSICDDVVAATVAAARDVSVGDPLDLSTEMGPVIDSRACERILAMIERAGSSGAGTLVAGGVRLGGELADGYFIAPTVFADVDPRSEIAQEEVFGPVQTVIPFETEAEAIALANDTSYGLAAYLHTRDIARVHRVAAAMEAGNVWVNGGFGIPSAAPFGGVKQSGYGRLGGRAGIAEFTRPKNIWIAL